MYRRIIVMASVAWIEAAFGFVVVPRRIEIPILPTELSPRAPIPTLPSIGRRRRTYNGLRRPSLLLLKYQYAHDDGNDSRGLNVDETEPSPKSSIPFIVNRDDDIRCHKKQKGEDDDASMDAEESIVAAPVTTEVSVAIKEVLTAPVLQVEDKKDDTKQQQQLILPVSASNLKSFGKNNKSFESSNPVREHREAKRANRKIDLGRKWRRLRPGQKFRFRLGIAALAFVSVWNTVIVRNYSGLISGIITGAATTTTATGFGGLVRRWFSLRGFQGIAALGRSIAYGWAIFVAYPRMLDRRAKDRRHKREEDILKQWRQILKGIAAEVVRLKRELSLLEGEIRTFRREILAIRAARVNNGDSRSKSNNSGNESPDENDNTSNTGSHQSDRILHEAIVNEMSHLTRLRDDTRMALTTARQRWSEVRAKRPTSHSKHPSSFDPLEFDFDAAPDLDYRYDDRDNRNDDLLLRGL